MTLKKAEELAADTAGWRQRRGRGKNHEPRIPTRYAIHEIK